MIYCAGCKKPSAKNSGPCPHCGEDLLGKKPEPVSSPDIQREGSSLKQVSKPEKAPGEDFDLGDISLSGIDLADDDYIPPDTGVRGGATVGVSASTAEKEMAGSRSRSSEPELQIETMDLPAKPKPRTPMAAMEIQDAEVREIAGFGKADSGVVGAVKYTLKVKSRLRDLEASLEDSKDRMVGAEERRLGLLSALGRQGHAAELTNDAMEHLVSAALKLDGELKGAERSHENMAAEHYEKKKELQATVAAVESDAEPIREEELKAQVALNGLRTEKKRVEAKLKRAGIEHRNITELIEKRQQAYADLKKPKEERRKLLADIAEFDKKQPEIVQRIELHTKEIDDLSEPLEQAEAVHREILGRLTVKTDRISALRKELENLTRVFEQQETSARKKIHGESLQSERAWSQVGERLFADGVEGDDETKTLVAEVAGASENMAQAKRRVELGELATDCYDKEVFKKGQKILIGAVAAGALLLVILICLSVF